MARNLVLSTLVLALSTLSSVDAAVARGDGSIVEGTSLRHQRQRRAMGDHQQQQQRQRRRYHNYPNGYSLQEEKDKKKKRYTHSQKSDASLSDVWLCYAFGEFASSRLFNVNRLPSFSDECLPNELQLWDGPCGSYHHF